MKKVNFSNSNFWDLVIISMRFLLALVFLSYGIGKLTENQFGNLTMEELNTPVKDLSLFKVSWFVFENEPFKSFIGISQVITSVLLLFRRTVIVGILMLIPIILNILIIDMTIMPSSLKIGFIFRLTCYLIFCGVILFSYKEDLVHVWKIITAKKNTVKHTYWKYLLIPVIMVVLEVIGPLLKFLYFLIAYPDVTIQNMRGLF